MLDKVTETQIRALAPRGSFLTTQELTFVKHYVRGMSPSQAAREAGYHPTHGTELLKKVEIAEACAVMREQVAKHLGVEITRDLISGMLLEAHRKASTATEEIAAARELGKLHGLYEPEKTTQVTKHVHTIQQLEACSDDDLIVMSQLPADRLIRPIPRSQQHEDVRADDTAAGESGAVAETGRPPGGDPATGPAA